jgi:hypothetical protein
MTVGREYAFGTMAWGICQRCGIRALLNDLVFDGRFAWLVVHPECYEPVHPQERLISVFDPVTLYRPSPESDNTVQPILEVEVAAGTATLTWSAADTLGARIEGYRVMRSADGETYTQVVDLPIVYSFLGAIETQILTYDDTPAAGSYTYAIDAYDCYQHTLRSNLVSATV